MKFYLAIDRETGRKILCPNQEKAKEVNKTFQAYDIPTDKDGLMEFGQAALDRIFDLEGQINSLKRDASIAPVTIVQESQEEGDGWNADHLRPRHTHNYVQQSLAIDDAWDELPLPRKLHFAALAMEAARTAVIKSTTT